MLQIIIFNITIHDSVKEKSAMKIELVSSCKTTFFECNFESFF